MELIDLSIRRIDDIHGEPHERDLLAPRRGRDRIRDALCGNVAAEIKDAVRLGLVRLGPIALPRGGSPGRRAEVIECDPRDQGPERLAIRNDEALSVLHGPQRHLLHVIARVTFAPRSGAKVSMHVLPDPIEISFHEPEQRRLVPVMEPREPSRCLLIVFGLGAHAADRAAIHPEGSARAKTRPATPAPRATGSALAAPEGECQNPAILVRLRDRARLPWIRRGAACSRNEAMNDSRQPEQRFAEAQAVLSGFQERKRRGDDEGEEALLLAHPHLRDLLEALLAHGEPPGSIPAKPPAALQQPLRIGQYSVLSVLGEGGMGTVYAAEQRSPVHRRVAIKVIQQGMSTKAVLARFEQERQALALMNSDHIARVYEAGATEQGQPYFVMEYVQGLPINRYSVEHKLDIGARIALFLQVCEGVQHAHHKGVIHRDLKPANVLISVQGDRAVPKIIDFGLARVTDRRLDSPSLYTQHGAMLGTPEYMSPEQADSNALDVDTRTDIYSLGVLLYELLAGALPFDPTELRSLPAEEMRRRIREQVPPRPSHRAGGDRSGGISAAEVRGDLDWITMKALEKDRTRRYATAHEIASDLRRYLEHEPVLAGPPSFLYRAKKLVRKYRTQTTILAVIGALVALGVGSLAVSWRRADRFLSELDALSFVVRLDDLKRSGRDELWPLEPATRPKIEEWLANARGLLEGAAQVDAVLAHLEQRVTSGSSDRFAVLRDKYLEKALLSWKADLEAFRVVVEGVKVAAARIPDLDRQTIGDDWARAKWTAAIESIASTERYGSLRITPQSGLIPVSADAETGLWYFSHAASGQPMWEDGRLVRDSRCGILLVLLPGGRVTIGASNSDRYAFPHEGPAVTVDLEPFFIGVTEITQSQWVRLAEDGRNPSHYNAEKSNLPKTRHPELLPVESIGWELAQRTLWHHGLTLPTEAQWEYACRAGTSGTWWFGDDERELDATVERAVAANLANGLDIRKGLELPPTFSDGTSGADRFPLHAEVALTRPNGFGLYDMIGNVWEWTLDPFAEHPGQQPPADYGRRPAAWTSQQQRVMRGGSWRNGTIMARCARRQPLPPQTTMDSGGARAARRLFP